MGVRLGAALLAVTAALGCSACSSFLLNGIGSAGAVTVTVSHSLPQSVHLIPDPADYMSAANRFLVRKVSGFGSRSIGTFAVRGTLYIVSTCKGKGPLAIPGFVTYGGCGNPDNPDVNVSSRTDYTGQRVHFSVHAKPGTKWRLAIGEHVKK